MTLTDVITVAINPALSLLPARLDVTQARVLLLAIGLQESKFIYRVQINGPANGLYQFEKAGGVRGVMWHPSTRVLLQETAKRLNYDFTEDTIYEAIIDNDVLATVCARLLLWSDPRPLPPRNDIYTNYQYYLRNWRPGKPHPEVWPMNYKAALDRVAV